MSKPPLGVASEARQSLFCLFASPVRIVLSLRAQRGNLSFVCLPTPNNRDRFVPRDDKSATLAVLLSLRAKRGNLSFGCLPTPNNRDRHVPRDDRIPCEATSLLVVCQPRTTEIATFLAMTGVLSLRAKRGNLSFVCLPTPNNRDRHVPRDDRSIVIASLRSNLSLFFSEPERRDRFVPRDDRIPCEAISLLSVCQLWKGEIATSLAMTGVLSLRACVAISILSVCQPGTTEIASFLAMTEFPAKQSLFCLFANPEQPRSLRSSR